MYEDLKQKIVDVMKYLDEKGLNYGKAGNASIYVRSKGHIVITPSGLEKSKLTPSDIVVVDSKGMLIEGVHKPTSELPLHLEIYKNYPFNAVIHIHPVYTSVLAVLREHLPPILEEMVMYTGGDVRVSEYAPYGTWDLARKAVEALKDRSAVILANHGLVTCGRSIEEALEVALVVERAAQIYVLARLLGSITLLPPSVIEHQKKIYKERISVTE